MSKSSISDAGEATSVEHWGPVRRGFEVWLADGRHGWVADIRLDRRGEPELLVTTGLFFPTIAVVATAEIEAILPPQRRIIVGEPEGSSAREALGEPVELPLRGGGSTDSPHAA